MEQKLCVDRREAASMVDLSPKSFTNAVRSGLLPNPIQMGGRKVWSVKALEKAIDRLAGLDDESQEPGNEWIKRLGKNRPQIHSGGSV
jgi:hypothetical protein